MDMNQPTRSRLRIPGGLTPELVETLCLLHGAAPGVAEATIALLPYGSRSNLASHGVIDDIPARKDAAGEISITHYGWEVIAACAHHFDDCGEAAPRPREATLANRRAQMVAAWRPRAEALDRELTRTKTRVQERFENVRHTPRTSA